MMFYSAANLPLVRALKGNGYWFRADMPMHDFVCAGSLADIHRWLDHFLELGPSYGYFPEPRKSYLVVAPNVTHLASETFAGLGISIVCDHFILKDVIGKDTQCENLIQLKVNQWVHSINALDKAARKSSHAAFGAMVELLTI